MAHKIRSVEELQSYGERELIEEIQTLDRMIIENTPSSKVRESIKRMVDYSYEDEQKHFAECESDMSEDNSQRTLHIFHDIKRVAQWIGGIRE